MIYLVGVTLVAFCLMAATVIAGTVLLWRSALALNTSLQDVYKAINRPVQVTLSNTTFEVKVEGLEGLLDAPLSVRLIDMEMVPMEYKVHRRVRAIPRPVELNERPMVAAKL